MVKRQIIHARPSPTLPTPILGNVNHQPNIHPANTPINHLGYQHYNPNPAFQNIERVNSHSIPLN